MTPKFKVGEKVKINLNMVSESMKSYTGVYKIVEIRLMSKGFYVYSLEGVPKWGTEEMLYKK